MAFKDLQREILEEFAESSFAEEREHEARSYVDQKQRKKNVTKRQKSDNEARFRAKLTRRHYVIPRLEPEVCCAVCRLACPTTPSLHSHYALAHPAIAAAQGPFRAQGKPSRAQLLAYLARAERRLAAAKDLVVALEEDVADASARLRASNPASFGEQCDTLLSPRQKTHSPDDALLHPGCINPAMKIMLVVVPDSVELPTVEGSLACVALPLAGNPGPAVMHEALRHVASQVARLLEAGHTPDAPTGQG